MNSYVESPWCEACGNEVEEHHSHVMGDCPAAVKLRDISWRKILNILDRNKILTPMEPWMTVSTKRGTTFSLEENICNRGMIPKEIRSHISSTNPHRTAKEIDAVMREIAEEIKNTNVLIWLSRLKKMDEKKKM